MKKKLGIIQVLAILIIGIMIGAFAERSHVFGYADNTPIIPSGTYKTTDVGNWKKIKISSTKIKYFRGQETAIIENRYTSRSNGHLVVASPNKGNRSWSYDISEIKEGWKISPIINGKPDHDSGFVIYAN